MNQLKIYSQTPYARLENFNEIISQLIMNTEKYYYHGILVVYSGQGYDPWILSTKILEKSENIIPLIAVQTDALTPRILAKRIESIHSIYNKRFDINMITGNAMRLQQSADIASNPNRYNWLCEFVNDTKKQWIDDCLTNNPFETTQFYLSGSSTDGLTAATVHTDGYLTVPPPIDIFSEFISTSERKPTNLGICFGILSRPSSAEAWEYANNMFPYTREDVLKTAMKRSSKLNSVKLLAQLLKSNDTYDNVYWLGVFRSGINSYPYLVGSYEEVADYLSRYISLGVNTLILNGPFSDEEFYHRQEVFKRLSTKIVTI